MRARRFVMAGLVACTALLGGAGTAAADEGDAQAAKPYQPAEAGTSFRTATAMEQGQKAQAVASTGDYLYWVFPAGAGQAPKVKATVTLPETATRSGSVTWQVDVYDGLLRRQACASGRQTKTASQDAETLTLSCTLPAVQPWADTWSNDPLPGAYYLRLTAVKLPDKDLGLPVRAEVEVNAANGSGARRGGGELAAPLLPAAQPGSTGEQSSPKGSEEDSEESDKVRTVALTEPDSGWMGGWWSDRILWTAGGGVLAALAGVGGYHLVGRRR
ncbi:hypothetical protein [Streptomyces gobiensis]|uniref:hypothetical protein n=1 Tax=Streptomyces gobiensis TaxID=2875706 RepID=UPI001E2EABF7|nr:hypothetical protein [Streptomyces gobiensis]UGY90754.1 hypothetical protein test1122_02780 [Streptomyces gobiensis]